MIRSKEHQRQVNELNRLARGRKRRILAAVKLQEGCSDCGYNQHPAALQFDHVGGMKVGGIGSLVSNNAPWERIITELMKCEVRCANCHAIVTNYRREEQGKVVIE